MYKECGVGYTCLHPVSVGLSAGIIWGIATFLLGLFAMFSGYGTEFVKVMGSVYVGYAPTFFGAIAGAIWGFVKLFIGGFLFSIIYNYFVCAFCDHEKDVTVKTKTRR